MFGFTEVRTTAGIVAAIIDVAAFAVLGCGAVSGLDAGRRVMGAVGAVSVIALVLTGVFVAAPRTPPPVAAAGSGQTLDARTISGKALLTNSKGITLYTFAPDGLNKSVCYGDCAAYWPPVPGNMSAGPGVTGKIGTITRTDGTTQATYDGHPLYTYIGDHGPGQDGGNNVNLNGGSGTSWWSGAADRTRAPPGWRRVRRRSPHPPSRPVPVPRSSSATWTSSGHG